MRYQMFTNNSRFSSLSKLLCITTAMTMCLCSSMRAAERQKIHHNVSPAETNSAVVARTDGQKRLKLAIGLPVRNRQDLLRLVEEQQNPSSTNYHQYLTPQEFAQKFGPSEQDYQTLVRFAEDHKLKVTSTHTSRMVLGVEGKVSDIEETFHVKLNDHKHPKENRTFHSPDTEPSIDLAVPVLGVSGLDDFALPRPLSVAKPLAEGVRPAWKGTGSGPTGNFWGNDFRAAYAPGVTLNGTGQTLALLQWDGYSASDITYYEQQTGLPNVPLQNVLLGFSGNPFSLNGQIEVSLDIEMAISMAPGLTRIIVYENDPIDGIWDTILSRIADDNLAKQISCSWASPGQPRSDVWDQIFLQMDAQGQSFFSASGDFNAISGLVPFPCDNPYITSVGGTFLATCGAGGSWAAEAVWNRNNGIGTGGGISSQYSIPGYQQGIDMSGNGGSATMRNIPDVALTADHIYVRAANTDYSVGGTSCSAPLWAGFTALANQSAANQGRAPVGFINPAVYAVSGGSRYGSSLHDIDTGDSSTPSVCGGFYAQPGYDLCTGLGTPAGSDLINALANPSLWNVTPPTVALFAGPRGGPFTPTSLSYSLHNNGSSSLSWAASSSAPWLNVSPSSGAVAPGGTIAITVTPNSAAANLTFGSYDANLIITDQSSQFVQRLPLTLNVTPSIDIWSQPVDLAVLEGATATFSVEAYPAPLLSFQWQFKRAGGQWTDLHDGDWGSDANISGANTSTLKVSGVSASQVGSYSVKLSTALETVQSDDAALSIVPSAPVIVQQPTNQTVVPGAHTFLAVGVVGTRPYTYQWQRNGVNLSDGGNIAGASSSALALNPVNHNDSGTYTVVVQNGIGSTLSIGAVLTVPSAAIEGADISTLVSFGGVSGAGSDLRGRLLLGTDGNFYGTTFWGGTYGWGTVFKMTPGGVITTLHSFAGGSGDGMGAFPGLIQDSSGVLYGTTRYGGASGNGTVFSITTAGVVTILHFFAGGTLEGWWPSCSLAQDAAGNLYGTTENGGANGKGTIFKLTRGSGWAFSTIHSFNGADGAHPFDNELVLGLDGNLYGMTGGGYIGSGVFDGLTGGADGGGAYSLGTVFQVTPNGTLTKLHDFTGGIDGSSPFGGLTLDADGNFYGTTSGGGQYPSSSGPGTIFKLSRAGSSWTFGNIYTFSGCTDGWGPLGTLVRGWDGTLYGTTTIGGSFGCSNQAVGAVFSLSPDGSSFTALAGFDGFNGSLPTAGLAWGNDNNLYGTTRGGGANQAGTVFRVSFDRPTLTPGTISDTSFSFNAGGAASSSWTVYASSDLTTWTSAGSLTLNSSGVGSFTDSVVSGVPSRFYKLSNGALCSHAVGFERSVVPANALGASVYQLYGRMNTIASLLGHAPNGSSWAAGTQLVMPDDSTTFTWNGSQWLNNSAQDMGNTPLSLGDGFSVYNPVSAPLTITITGVVPEGHISKTATLVAGQVMTCSPVPQAGAIASVLGYQPVEGDIIQLWANGGFSQVYTYNGGLWNPAEPYVQVGQTVNIVSSGSGGRTWARLFSPCDAPCSPPVVAVGSLTSSQFSFSATGQASSSWGVYSSSDLVTWSSVGSLTLNSSGSGTFTDTTVAGVQNRFYKLNNGTCCSHALGFEQFTEAANQYMYSVYQLQARSSSLGSLFGHALDGSSWPSGVTMVPPTSSTVYTWNGSSWLDSSGNNANGVTLSLGDGYQVWNQTATPIVVTVMGLVPEGHVTRTVTLAYGQIFTGSPVPQAGLITSLLGYQPLAGESAWLWNNSGWDMYSYQNGAWSPQEPYVQVGQMVYINNSSGSRNWTRDFSVCDSACSPPSVVVGTLTSSQFSFTAKGQPHSTWTVYQSSDLTSWSSVGSITLNSLGSRIYTDSTITGVPNRFYKLSNGTCCSRALGFEEATASGNSSVASVYQLQTAQNTIGSLFGHALDGSAWPNGTELVMPDNNTVYSWNGSTWLDYLGQSANNATLSLGDGYGVNNYSANPLTVAIAGLVPEGYLAKTITPVVLFPGGGQWMTGSLIPQAGPLVSVLGYQPMDGDLIQLWGNGNWESQWFIYSGGFWYDNFGLLTEEPFVNVGQTVSLATDAYLVPLTRNWARTYSVCY
jgi:uncharacterized repeat protein (TIGR03803 family)